MTVLEQAIRLGETLPMPDSISRAAVAWLVGRTNRKLSAPAPEAEANFARGMAGYPIALNTAEANVQHYEVPAEFFDLVLGPQRKYSCCFYDTPATTLAQAEERALGLTAEHAGLADGQRILELGCGWGSLSLWMAKSYPAAKITSVSNSNSQRAFILGQAATRGLRNLEVVTADMNDFTATGTYDRVVSVEMFEHMANWRPLLERVRAKLDRDGKLFIHIFSHRQAPYRFDVNDKADWIAQHFFTGGIMPSHNLIRQFGELFSVEQDWWWSGEHYRRTADHWLENFDRNCAAIDRVLARVYGKDAALWRRRWRLFFLATSGLFGHGGGRNWGVSHYRLAPV